MANESRGSRPGSRRIGGRLARTAVIAGAWGFAVATACAAAATSPVPEIVRPTGLPQAIGTAHTLRTIPEACTRLEGRFTGNAAAPYALDTVRSRPNCQPRARFVDAAHVKPSVASGWVLNDEIRVPNAVCPRQQAIVRVWRKPVDVAPPKLDAQGRARLYLQEAQQAAQANRVAPVPQFAAQMRVDGRCG